MSNEVINGMIAKGNAQYGTYTNTGSLQVLRCPKNKAIVITEIRLKAFADLPGATTFAELDQVVESTWHMLRVISDGVLNIFHARHEIRSFLVGQTTNYLPQGETVWEVFLGCGNDIIFELSKYGANMDAAALTITPNTLPAEITGTNNPNVPNGYGKTGVAGSLNALQYVTHAAEAWEVRPFGDYTRSSLVGGGQSTTQFQWALNANHALAQPRPNIPFGSLTFPLLEIRYALINKNPDGSFKMPV